MNDLETLLKALRRGIGDAVRDHELMQSAADALEKLRAENAALVSEGCMLAAGQCLFPDGDGLIGDDHGNPVCLKDREVDKLRAENAELRAVGERDAEALDKANHFFTETIGRFNVRDSALSAEDITSWNTTALAVAKAVRGRPK